MKGKFSDLKLVASLIAFIFVAGVVFVIIGWSDKALERAKKLENPTEKVLQRDGLL